MFDNLVLKINKHLAPSGDVEVSEEEKKFIGVLDIYGMFMLLELVIKK
jgi:myosin heavy subunit